MKIKNNELLTKIIELQSCIIQGRNVKAIMHKNLHFYLEHSGADIITICINETKKIYMEHVFERDKKFEHFIKENILNKRNLNCQYFITNYQELFKNNKHYYLMKNLYSIFKGILSQKEATEFTKFIEMNEAIIMPIYNIEFEKRIAYITFIFQGSNKKDLDKLEEMKNFFEILIQPLYDYKNNLMFSKCTRVDQHFKLLTPQEKRVIRKVLRGKSYIEIAEIMGISINTVKSHMKNIFNKYSVCSKMELYNKIIDHIL